jgi:hypothetical protein
VPLPRSVNANIRASDAGVFTVESLPTVDAATQQSQLDMWEASAVSAPASARPPLASGGIKLAAVGLVALFSFGP